jgi:hypothetical protein
MELEPPPPALRPPELSPTVLSLSEGFELALQAPKPKTKREIQVKRA